MAGAAPVCGEISGWAAADVAERKIDESFVAETANRLWLLMLFEKQEMVVGSGEHLDIPIRERILALILIDLESGLAS
jgi:hypothetical protein